MPLLDGALRKLYLRLERHGVEVIDLLPVFLEARVHDFEGQVPSEATPYQDLVFLRQDVHWSSYGSMLAAQVLGRRVRAYPWYPDTLRSHGRAVLVEEVRWQQRHGSIAGSMIEAGKLDSGTEMEHFPLRDVRIDGERWSLNDRTSPVAVLGDSYRRLAYGFPQQLLKELGYRVEQVTVPMGNQSGQLRKLRLRSDKLEGKRLVIWQIATPAFLGQSMWAAVDVF